MSAVALPAGPLLIGIADTELDAQARSSLLHPALGGVVLFSRNYESRDQLVRLVADLRALREPRLLVCIDQEGGRVQRLREGFTRLPPLGSLGRMYRSEPDKAVDMAYRHGRVMATEVLACGIDLSFAPVLDLDRGSEVIGDRSLGASPEQVVALGRAYLAGMHDAGMRTTGKHFPGHGSVSADSHVEQAVDPRGLADLEAQDLRPFRELITELDALMIAHVIYPEIDADAAGFSGFWLRNYLRAEWGYRGLIISDDLCMQGAEVAGGLEARLEACLAAGCDLALVCQPDAAAELIGGLDGSFAETCDAVGRLYGRPTLSAGDLVVVREEGIGEWSRWKRSLEELAERARA